MWIHEGWTTYLEIAVRGVHVRARDDALKYINGYKTKVQKPTADHHRARRLHRTPPQDQYFKGALFLNTLRSVVDDDEVVDAAARFLPALQVPEHHDRGHGRVLQPADGEESDADLRSVSAPHGDAGAGTEVRRAPPGTVDYRWKADVASFNMPIKVGAAGAVDDDPADDRVGHDEEHAVD